MSLEKVIDDKITDLLMKIDKQKLPKHVAIRFIKRSVESWALIFVPEY